MLGTTAATATAMSPNSLALGPSLLVQEQSDPSPRRPPTAATHSPPAFPAPQDDSPPPHATANSSTPWTPGHKPSLSFNDSIKTGTRPLIEYHTGYAHAHADEHVAQPRTAFSPTRATFASYLPASIRARLQSPGKSPQPHPGQHSDEAEYGNMGLTGEGRKTRRELAESQTLGSTKMSRPQQAKSEGCQSPETIPTGTVRTSGPPATENTPKSAGPTAAPKGLSLLTMFTKPPPAVTPEMHDELLNLNVDEALFPTGRPNTKDPFSPAAFKNLQTQATGLLTKMQTAYRQKAEALIDLEAERDAEREEYQESETRAKHLKFQLEDMASKAGEQERRMKRIMEELAAERRARVELEKFQNPKATQRLSVPSPGGFQSEAGSTTSEDLGVDEEELQKRKWRKSNGTDTSFETDDDNMSLAESESVFSRTRSPSASSTITTTRPASVIDVAMPTPQSMRGQPALTTGTNKRSSVASVASTSGGNGNRRSTQQMTTFQKLMKGISGGEGCPNCKGQDASVAWDTVGLLRDENKGLKHRVGELEDCLEGALDAVNGIGL